MKESIIGKKVILREHRNEDAEFFSYWFNQPKVMFQCGFFEETTKDEELAALNKPEIDCDWYTVTDLSDRIIGEAGLLRINNKWSCTDMTMIIPNPKDQGKGYGTEAGKLILSRAFYHYNMNRVSIGVVGLNEQALKYWEKIGFKKEGIQEQGYYYNGEYSDFIMMRILKSEYDIIK